MATTKTKREAVVERRKLVADVRSFSDSDDPVLVKDFAIVACDAEHDCPRNTVNCKWCGRGMNQINDPNCVSIAGIHVCTFCMWEKSPDQCRKLNIPEPTGER